VLRWWTLNTAGSVPNSAWKVGRWARQFDIALHRAPGGSQLQWPPHVWLLQSLHMGGGLLMWTARTLCKLAPQWPARLSG
jgi:hypothetical protein